jgi:hypothetical protein
LKEAKSRSENGDDHQQIQELPKTPEFTERGSSGFDGETDPIPELIPDPDRGAYVMVTYEKQYNHSNAEWSN